MHIATFTVSYSETANLGDYSNVKPSATVDVVLGEDDDFETSFADAQALVRRAVQAEVDDALEVHGRPARYSSEPRYTLFTRHRRIEGGLPTLEVIGPADAAYHPSFSRSYRNFRLPAIRRLADEHAHYEHNDQRRLIDTTQDPDALAPLLEQIVAEEAQLEAERERQREEQKRKNEEWQRRYAAQHAANDDGGDDDDED